MSLLIDALKQAERARELALESSPAATDRPQGMGTRAATSSAQATARKVFSPEHRVVRRPAFVIAMALSAMLALAAGGYFWWQLQALGRPSIAPPSARAAAPAAPPVAVLASAAPAAAKPVTVTLAADPPRTLTPPADPRRAAGPAKAPGAAAAAAKTPLPAADHESGVSFRRSTRAAPAQPRVENAYAAMRGARLAEARRHYEEALRGDARNIDALLGLATIAVREARLEDAQALYTLALEADPHEPTAVAGLTSLQPDAERATSQLKNVLANRPEAAAAHFALGNLYARQARWSEAQQAYFNAYTLEPANADLAYNLAVSLDHLRQAKLALAYYRQALQSAAGGQGFDAGEVAQRIAELEP